MARFTRYNIVIAYNGNRTVLPMTSERHTKSVLIKALFANRDLVLANVPAACFEADESYKNGVFNFGGALLFFEAA
jgi:hypothetical protein